MFRTPEILILPQESEERLIHLEVQSEDAKRRSNLARKRLQFLRMVGYNDTILFCCLQRPHSNHSNPP